MRQVLREDFKHPSKLEAAMLQEYQGLRAAGDWNAADKALGRILDRYQGEIENVGILLTDDGWEWRDAYQSTRANMANLIGRHDIKRDSLVHFIGLFCRPSRVRIERDVGQSRGKAIGGPPQGGGRVPAVETNQMRRLQSVIDPQSADATSDFNYEQAEALQVAYLVLRLPNEIGRYILLRRYGMIGDAESLGEVGTGLGVTGEAVRKAQEKAEVQVRSLYDPPQRGGEILTIERIEELERVIIRVLSVTLQAIADSDVSNALWRYYDLDGLGKYTLQMIAHEYRKSINWVYRILHKGQSFIDESVKNNTEIQAALKELGLAKLAGSELLISFGDELRAALKKSGASATMS